MGVRKIKYMKNIDIRDHNEVWQKLGLRLKEIDCLISELPFVTKLALGQEACLDMEQLTVMGHGFGATTAIFCANKDERVKNVISYDPYLIPLKD